jgi:hypothetical protein
VKGFIPRSPLSYKGCTINWSDGEVKRFAGKINEPFRRDCLRRRSMKAAKMQNDKSAKAPKLAPTMAPKGKEPEVAAPVELWLAAVGELPLAAVAEIDAEAAGFGSLIKMKSR